MAIVRIRTARRRQPLSHDNPPAALSDAELLSLLLRPGACGQPAVAVAQQLLARYRHISHLLAAPLAEVAAFPGIGPERAARLALSLELTERSLREQMQAGDTLASPAAVRGFLRLRMQDLGHEVFWAVFLDAQNRVIAAEELFRGTLTQTSVYPREVVKQALAHNAAGLILAHNHPSGLAEPSLQDQSLTRALAESLALVDVKVVDHFIVTRGACLSFAERGLL